MIYITGDIHGDFSRFKSPLLRKLKKNDALIVCGDFGFIWEGTQAERKILKKSGSFHTMCCSWKARMITTTCWNPIP